jgi:hypothetical protein
VSDDLKLDKLIAELQKRRAPACSLKKFTEEAWHVVEPGVGYVGNWHADAICEHLEAVSRGQIRKLLINVPPGTAKSTFCCVMWPAWTWTFRPEWRALFATYSDALSLRDAAKTRLLLESDWYRQTFAPAWELARDTNAKGYFQNTRLGFRFSTSVGGAGTGLRGDAIVIDDPLNAPDAKSKAEREAVKFWWDQGFANRLNNMATGSRVIIMQRLHEEDLSGTYSSRAGGNTSACRRSSNQSADAARRSGSSTLADRGRAAVPRPVPEVSVLDDEKVAAKGSSGYAGQYQQRPGARGRVTGSKKPGGVSGSPTGRLAVGTRRPRRLQRRAARFPAPALSRTCLISVDCTFKGQSRAGPKSELDYVSIVVVIGKSGANKYHPRPATREGRHRRRR